MVSDSECQPNVAGVEAVTIDVNWWEQKTFPELSFSFGVPAQRYLCAKVCFLGI